jgi:hypothetical protein
MSKNKEPLSECCGVKFKTNEDLGIPACSKCGAIKVIPFRREIEEPNKVTRLEVIDQIGRAYVKWDCEIKLSYQDDGRTLKIFVKDLLKINHV